MLTFLAASSLSALDLGLLAWSIHRLGQRPKTAELALLALAIGLKLALLVGGALWISHQSWYQRNGLVAGLMAPFALFVLWQALRMRHGKPAQGSK